MLTYHEAFSNMADIDLFHNDDEDNADDGYSLDDRLDMDEAFGNDDNLAPLVKLEKYMESDNVYTRQMVAKGLLDTLRAVGDSEEQTTAVLTAMVRLADDSDPIVRSELMEQVAHIAVYCHENPDIFHNAIPVYILPMVVRYLDDSNHQVRKTSQAGLLVLLEQELVDREHIEEQVVNVILELASPDNLDEYRTEAVALMSKMAPLLGKDMTERVFLDRFSEMCTDPLFHVRKVCAANFGDFCSVVSQESAEQKLLPKFYFLCEDGVWGVRKACAECFMAVSCACSPEVRKSDLSSLFVNLLCDQSRWVRMAAFQQLGPFISTFADSDLTGLYVDIDGQIVFKHETIERRVTESEEDQISEIQDSDIKPLPDVVTSSSSIETQTNADSAYTSPTNCDTNSVLNQVEMDLSEDDLASPDVRSDISNDDVASTADSQQSELFQSSSSEDQSVEEMRAEFYSNNLLEPCDIESNKDVQKDTEEVVDQRVLEDAGSSLVQENLDKNNSGQSCDISSLEGQDICQGALVSPTDSDCNTSSSETKSGHVHIHLDNVNNSNDYDAFQFWRTPLPQIDLDLDVINGKAANIHVTARVNDEEHHKVYASQMNVEVSEDGSHLATGLSDSVSDLSVCDKDSTTVMSGSETVVTGAGTVIRSTSISSVSEDLATNMGGMFDLGQHLEETTLPVIDGVVQDINLGHIDSNLLLSLLPIADLSGATLPYMDSDFSSPQSLRDSLMFDDATLAKQQDIVPQSLLENYLGMIDPSRAQTVDTEITKYCAYNIPAVAYTLGRSNWQCIRNLYETLAADMQWKVRRTLAFSIHELAVILGEDITHRDLVPIFDGFLKDLDEVRIGILRHLADFLRLLHPDVRRQYLIKVQDFMNVDNNRNWRFRQELAEQLVLISELFSAQEISDYLLPLALALAEDKVSEVRIDAYHLVSVMLKRMADSRNDKLVQNLINQLLNRFAYHQKWARRQIYTQLCQAILREEAVEPVQFAQDFLPSLITLADDPVPNVRITLAKSMTCYMLNEEYSNCDAHPRREELDALVKKLQEDSDRDVQYFISADSYIETTTVHNTSDSMSDSMCA